MSHRPLKVLAATLACSLLPVAAAQAASGPPPPPKSPTGKTVTEVGVGGGMFTPTAFAFGDGQLFEADGGLETAKVPNGGVFAIQNGAGVKIPSPLLFVSGLAWHQGSLYVAGGAATSPTNVVFSIQKWSGWNGTAFSSQKVIYTAPKKFQGFNGIAFGPDGRLYVGTDVGLLNGNDHGPAKTPYVYSILSMKANGKGLKVFATGIRQPWQMAFAPGSKNPLVSDLGQDGGVKNPPDFILQVHQGDDFGFPGCNHTVAAKCKGFAKPFKMFKPHTDIMGMAIIGKTLYMTSFLGTTGKAGEVFSMPLSGGKLTPVLKGFVAPTVGLGANGKTLYVGELGGKVGKVLEPAQIFSVNP
jgi:glucose/arabinose dehydrogenase